MKWLVYLAFLAAMALGAAPGVAENRYAAFVRVAGSDGTVLHIDHGDEPRAPASLTKLMTLYLLFEALEDGRASLSDEVTISPFVAQTAPFKLGLKTGEAVSLNLLMRATAIRSANDAAVAIAEHLSGTEEEFARHMTITARRLGMTRTRFRNASGLPASGQLTTARDIATLSDAILRDFPEHHDLFRETSVTYAGKSYPTTNGFLWAVEGADGLKTGFTQRSGYNLAATATRHGTRIIAVVLGGTGTRARNAHAADLVNAAFTRHQAIMDHAPPTATLASVHLLDRSLRQEADRLWRVRFGRAGDHGSAILQAQNARDLIPSDATLAEAGAWRRGDGQWLAELSGLTSHGAQAACPVLPAHCILVPPLQQ
jgi:D-alanyl-D-alanine carboxypeptidase